MPLNIAQLMAQQQAHAEAIQGAAAAQAAVNAGMEEAVGTGAAGQAGNLLPDGWGAGVVGAFQAADQAGLNFNAVYGPGMPKKSIRPAPADVKIEDDTTIGALFGLVPVSKGVLSATQFIGGLECEIEAVPKNKNVNVGHMQCKEDGSLRNSGFEWVSLPLHRPRLIQEFKLLQEFLELDLTKDPFGERTSVHVHVNVASLTVKQAKNMLMLYALFEKLFFSMVKPDRVNNIHCVPLSETHLPMYYHRDIYFLAGKWSKYSALNLCRMKDLGTMEFRHHHGTGDTEEISIWLKVLDNLWTLSRQVVMDAESLADPNRIHAWFSTIFQPSEKTMMLAPQLMNIIENGLIDVKFSTIKEAPAASKEA